MQRRLSNDSWIYFQIQRYIILPLSDVYYGDTRTCVEEENHHNICPGSPTGRRQTAQTRYSANSNFARGTKYLGVAELAYAIDLSSIAQKGLRVRSSSPRPQVYSYKVSYDLAKMS